ncbi:MAG: hypothetical protein IJ897_00635 [Prevotella sp.]|nr:hypothetical protein [Prevotella sp.]
MNYLLGGHIIRINVSETSRTVSALNVESSLFLDHILPSFIPFKIGDADISSDAQPLMNLTIVDNLNEIKDAHLIRDIDTGNGMTRVDRLSSGGYQFLVRDITGFPCALLQTSSQFSNCKVAIRGSLPTMRFALNNALMLSYAFSSAYYDTLLIHASVVRHNGLSYAFTAKSGTGKSTQVANWLQNIHNCDLVNDDNPIIRIECASDHKEKHAILYGSPWSGKTPCYRNVKAPLAALVMIKRDDHNEMLPQSPLEAFVTVLSACSAMKWDTELYSRVCKTSSLFVENIQVTELHCLPDAQSAITACNYLTK